MKAEPSTIERFIPTSVTIKTEEELDDLKAVLEYLYEEGECSIGGVLKEIIELVTEVQTVRHATMEDKQ